MDMFRGALLRSTKPAGPAAPHLIMDTPHTAITFPLTRWSMVLAAAGRSDSDTGRALQEICRQYWAPLYSYARQWGLSPEDAEDRTQEFLITSVNTALLTEANPAKGRLRTFLLKAFQHDLLDARRRETSRKRGGGCELIALETAEIEGLMSLCSTTTPEGIYDHVWAVTTLKQAVQALGIEYASAGKTGVFETLRGFLDPGAEPDHTKAAEALGLNPNALRQAVFRLRQRFRTLLRQQLADTLQFPDEQQINEELEAIKAALLVSVDG